MSLLARKLEITCMAFLLKALQHAPSSDQKRGRSQAKWEYVIEPALVAKNERRIALAEGAKITPAIVKPKGQKQISLQHKRKGE